MKEETINTVLDKGTEIVLSKGFNNVGINEILETVGIPKGSFYYYFDSKEDFGLQLIDRYSKKSLETLKRFLEDDSKNPKERILGFYLHMRNHYQQKNYREGCLLGNCSLELSDLKESYSKKIASALEEWEDVFVKCIEDGQAMGNIQNVMESRKLAGFMLNNWEGALLRMKATKSPKPLDIFIEFTEKLLS